MLRWVKVGVSYKNKNKNKGRKWGIKVKSGKLEREKINGDGV